MAFLKISERVVSFCCDRPVPIVLLIICLTIVRMIMRYLILKQKKEDTMEQERNVTKMLNAGVKSIFDVVWTIGTSIAADCML